jgi:hypothetical protein
MLLDIRATRRTSCGLRLTAIACLAAAPLPLAAQWRIAADPAPPARPTTVTADLRERADSLLADEDAVSLVLRCTARQLDAFLTTRDQLESDMAADVRVRVESDSLRPRDARWQATKANTGAFVPGGDLRELLQRRLLHTQTLRLTVSTQKRGRVTYTFVVPDARPAMNALRTACPNDRSGALDDR